MTALNGNAELVEKVAEQMHYAACEFVSPDTPLDTIKATFPWQALDARRRDGCLAMARAAIAVLFAHGDAKLVEEARALAKVVAERMGPDYSDGVWLTCSGCHESCDGYDVGHYPHSIIFNCKLGGGCSECGGIGAIWDTTDYEAMGRELSGEPSAFDALSTPHGDATVFVCSNPRCTAVWNADPRGHCPKCVQPSGVGWSTLRCAILAGAEKP